MNGINEHDLIGRHSEESDRLRDVIKEKDRILSIYKKEHGILQVFFNEIVKHITPLDPVEPIYKQRKKSKAVAVMQISDAHMGSVQEPYEIEGFNRFNAEICRQRQKQYAHSFVNWVDAQRNAYGINDCHIIVTGDLISGDIHSELQITNEFPVPVQIVEAAKVLAAQVASIAPNFANTIVHFITADNHGRLTKKPQAKEEGTNHYNYVVAELARAYLANHNVDFRVYAMHEKVIDVNNRLYLISHGHGIQGWMGIPWYSIARKVNREAMARMEIIMNEQKRMREVGFHKYIFGHYHTPFDHPHYSCCGSVSGTDAYDHKNGRHADPSQASWLVHEKYGEFNRINFNLKSIL